MYYKHAQQDVPLFNNGGICALILRRTETNGILRFGQVARWAFVIQTAPTVLTLTVAPPCYDHTAPTVRRNNFFRSCDFSKLNYIYYKTYTG